jgi:hypothetical protein
MPRVAITNQYRTGLRSYYNQAERLARARNGCKSLHIQCHRCPAFHRRWVNRAAATPSNAAN